MTDLNIYASGFSDVLIMRHHNYYDHRGHFSRIFCTQSVQVAGLSPHNAQINFTHTLKRGTVRGLHYQCSPHSERKIICCVRGAIYDVLLDLRAQSPTRGQWQAFELNEQSGESLIVPAGFAHGFQAQSDDVEMIYLHDVPYHAESQRGVRFDDPSMAIAWPLVVTDVSEKDRQWPLLMETLNDN